jgi:uncharacterized membrane protein
MFGECSIGNSTRGVPLVRTLYGPFIPFSVSVHVRTRRLYRIIMILGFEICRFQYFCRNGNIEFGRWISFQLEFIVASGCSGRWKSRTSLEFLNLNLRLRFSSEG